MANELKKKLKEAATCISNAEEEQAIFILLLLLKNYSMEIWQEQFQTLIELKKQLSVIPAQNRSLVHSLLEHTLMACIDKSLSGKKRLSLPDCKEIFLSKPDSAEFINSQEALEYRLGKVAFITARALAEQNSWEEIPFFLTQARGRHVILDKDEKLLMNKLWLNNQED